MLMLTSVASFFGKFRGGSKESLLVKSKALGSEYQSKNAFGPGVEINPAKGERLVATRIGSSDSYLLNIAGISDLVQPDTLPGERRFFSVDTSGELSAFLKLKNNGVLELNGNTDFAVKYNKLEIAFNELKTDFNNLVTVYNSHSHGGAVFAPVATGTPSAADISPAKSDTLKLK